MVIPDKEYAVLEMVSRALKLVLASKRLLSSAIPLGHYLAAEASLPIVGVSTDHSTCGWHSHAKLVTSEPVMALGLGLIIFMGLSGLRPKTNGHVAVCHTTAPPPLDSFPATRNESRTYLDKPTAPREA